MLHFTNGSVLPHLHSQSQKSLPKLLDQFLPCWIIFMTTEVNPTTPVFYRETFDTEAGVAVYCQKRRRHNCGAWCVS